MALFTRQLNPQLTSALSARVRWSVASLVPAPEMALWRISAKNVARSMAYLTEKNK